MSHPGVFATFRDAFTTVLGVKFWGRLRVVIMVLVSLAAFRSCTGDWSEVPSASMVPTILPGDRILVNKLAYDLKVPFTLLHLFQWSNPHRGDVIVFISPTTGLRLVKRVVGIPGDTIELKHNHLWLNGLPARYVAFSTTQPGPTQYLLESTSDSTRPITVSTLALPRQGFPALTVPTDHYFVMGDNRDDSLDSRVFGAVDRGLIIGRSTRVFWSLDPAHFFSPRWNRTLTRLAR